MKITRLNAPVCATGEGPIWDTTQQVLYYLDITGMKVHRYDPATATTRTWSVPKSVGSLALRSRGDVVVAQGTEIHALDLGTGALTPLAKIEGLHPRALINDGKADARGRFVVGACDSSFEDTRPIGGIYSVGADHKVTQLDGGIHFSNSPCFSPDSKTLYFADSFPYALYAYDYDLATGQAGHKRLFACTHELGGLPDGATVDRDGLVWVAIFEAGKIAAYRPDGKLERTVAMPVKMPASVMFGGADLSDLYVTSVNPSFFGRAADEGAGSLFVIEGLGARGMPEPRYAG